MSDNIKKIINILYLSGEETEQLVIADLLGTTSEDVASMLPKVKEGLATVGLGLFTSGTKVSIVTNGDYAELLKDFTHYTISGELSPAALQTLTIIAYLGEVSSAQISFIRGVQSGQSLRNLTTRGLVVRVQKNRQDIYSLSPEALHFLGIEKNEDLPEFENTKLLFNEKLKESLNG